MNYEITLTISVKRLNSGWDSQASETLKFVRHDVKGVRSALRTMVDASLYGGINSFGVATPKDEWDEVQASG